MKRDKSNDSNNDLLKLMIMFYSFRFLNISNYDAFLYLNKNNHFYSKSLIYIAKSWCLNQD